MRETMLCVPPLALAIALVSHPVAQPLSSSKADIVTVTGCLGPGTGDSWLLTHATEPAVASGGRASTPAAAGSNAAAAGAPVPLTGRNRFRLIGTREFDVASYKGHTVRVKGLLILADEKRINVTSVQDVAVTCGDGTARP